MPRKGNAWIREDQSVIPARQLVAAPSHDRRYLSDSGHPWIPGVTSLEDEDRFSLSWGQLKNYGITTDPAWSLTTRRKYIYSI